MRLNLSGPVAGPIDVWDLTKPGENPIHDVAIRLSRNNLHEAVVMLPSGIRLIVDMRRRPHPTA